MDSINNIAKTLMSCGGTVWTCGNGGSATTAMHFAQDLVRACKIKSICIADVGYLTATANDDGYDKVFSQFMDLFYEPNDMLVIFSGSGNSTNVVKVAQEMYGKIKIIGFVGFDGGQLKNYCDLLLHVKKNDMRTVESEHLDLAHKIVDAIVKYEKSV